MTINNNKRDFSNSAVDKNFVKNQPLKEDFSFEKVFLQEKADEKAFTQIEASIETKGLKNSEGAPHNNEKGHKFNIDIKDLLEKELNFHDTEENRSPQKNTDLLDEDVEFEFEKEIQHLLKNSYRKIEVEESSETQKSELSNKKPLKSLSQAKDQFFKGSLKNNAEIIEGQPLDTYSFEEDAESKTPLNRDAASQKDKNLERIKTEKKRILDFDDIDNVMVEIEGRKSSKRNSITHALKEQEGETFLQNDETDNKKKVSQEKSATHNHVLATFDYAFNRLSSLEKASETSLLLSEEQTEKFPNFLTDSHVLEKEKNSEFLKEKSANTQPAENSEQAKAKIYHFQEIKGQRNGRHSGIQPIEAPVFNEESIKKQIEELLSIKEEESENFLNKAVENNSVYQNNVENKFEDAFDSDTSFQKSQDKLFDEAPLPVLDEALITETLLEDEVKKIVTQTAFFDISLSELNTPNLKEDECRRNNKVMYHRSLNKRRFSKFGYIFITLLTIGLILAGSIYAYLKYSFRKAGPLENTSIILIKPDGGGIRSIARQLKKENIINSDKIFTYNVALKNLSGSLRAGEYEIPAHASMSQVVDILVAGKSVKHAFTVPEGVTVKQVFIQLKKNTFLAGELPETLPEEGSLFADTINFDRGTSRAKIVTYLQNKQKDLIDEIWNNRDLNIPLKSKEELVILASIIEKETGKPKERPLISAVFNNRLKKNMRLQSDPTVLYGIFAGDGKPSGRSIYRSDLIGETPYNTYKISGLPPTPIAIPGRASLEAAAHPAKSDALYFVADGTGGHVFSKTLSEHLEKVKIWRKIEKTLSEQQ